jgi:hypothetical protein
MGWPLSRQEMLDDVSWWLEIYELDPADVDDHALLDLWSQLQEVDDE